jgi:glycerol-3-phosphate dehydrogenase (NAD(P)+)
MSASPTSGATERAELKVAILGAGAWGTALAISLGAQHAVRLWARHGADAIARDRISPYLPGCRIPEPVELHGDFAAAVSGAELALVVTPTAGLRETAAALAGLAPGLPLLWACKGFESASGKLPHEIVAEMLPRAARVGALSGPSFAQEVALGLPTALTVASREGEFASSTARALNSPRLRIYSSTDLVGVELGGALKNVIAIAAGIADGLELGRNARAALITRGLAEMVRLGVAMGGAPETFMGLTGLGDLVLTCTGDLSRNREVGVRLARGKSLETVLAELGHVAEGVHSARSALACSRRAQVEMPITEAVCAVLAGEERPQAAVQRLLSRDPKAE